MAEVEVAIRNDPRLRSDDAELLLKMCGWMRKRDPFGGEEPGHF